MGHFITDAKIKSFRFGQPLRWFWTVEVAVSIELSRRHGWLGDALAAGLSLPFVSFRNRSSHEFRLPARWLVAFHKIILFVAFDFKSFPHMFNSTCRLTHNHRIRVQESRLANVRHVVLSVQLLARYFESENALFPSFAARRNIHDVPPG